MARYIIGDIHGSFKALKECLSLVNFDGEKDELYFVGDVADGYPEVYECLRFFKSLKHFYPVIGNHDIWLQNYLKTGYQAPIWLRNGGAISIKSFEKVAKDEKLEIASFLSTWPYVRILSDAVVMHGGPGAELSDQDIIEISKMKREQIEPLKNDVYTCDERVDTILWDRYYFKCARFDEEMGIKKKIGAWSEEKLLIIGHTEFGSPSIFFSRMHNMINLDTMAGSYGRLAIMDLESFEVKYSTPSKVLYPGFGPEYW